MPGQGIKPEQMKVLVADSVRLFQQLVASLFSNTGLRPVVANMAGERQIDLITRYVAVWREKR